MTTSPTRPVRTAAAPTGATSLPETTSLAELRRPNEPGPRFFRRIRLIMIVATLVAAAFGIAALQVAHYSQQASAAAISNQQNLQDLRASVSQAQSDALSALADSSSDATQWQIYEQTSQQIDLQLLTAAGGATEPGDLVGVATAVRHWQTALAVAHENWPALTDKTTTLAGVTTAFTDATTAISSSSQTSTPDHTEAVVFLVIGLALSFLTAIGFLTSLVLFARRTHRVVNIGLALGLIAAIASTVVVGNFALQSQAIDAHQSVVSGLAQARIDVWDSRTQDIHALIDAQSCPDCTQNATLLIAGLGQNLGSFALSSDIATAWQALEVFQSTLDSTGTTSPAQVNDTTSWQELSTALTTVITDLRPAPTALVISSLGPSAALAGLGLFGLIATLVGVNSRLKEYS